MGPGPNQAVGPWHHCVELCPAQWAWRGGCCTDPSGSEGTTPSKGDRVPEGCSQVRASIPSVSSSSDDTSVALFAKRAILGKKKSVQGAWDVAAQPSPRRTIMQMGSLVRAKPF